MVKTIFLQDLKYDDEDTDEHISQNLREKIIKALKKYIDELEEELERAYKLRKRKNLYPEENNLIKSYLKKRIEELNDNKIYLHGLLKKMECFEGIENLKEDIESILKALPIKKER